LLKVDANDLKTLWAVQLSAERHKNNGEDISPTTAKAFDCAVSGDKVYVGGIVDDGAGIVFRNRPRSSRGGDDVWLASINTNNGAITWVRQIGSAGNDHIAPHGGLTINKQGNVLLFGDTNGEIFRNHDESDGNLSEFFLMEVHADGSHKPHVFHEKAAPVSAPAPAPSPSKPGKPQSTPPPFLVDSKSKKSGLPLVLVIILSVVGGLTAISLIVFCCRKGFCCRKKTDAKVAARDGIFNTAKIPPPSSFQQNINVHLDDEEDDDEDEPAVNDII